jgi:adenosylhomocysteine nucleosidase
VTNSPSYPWDQFGTEFTAIIDAFVNEVEALPSDVLVATARKSVCLLDALRRSGRLKTDKLVVSDRVLDMDMSWLRGRDVGLIDELVISGSTLHDIGSELDRLVSRLDVRVAAVDKDWWNSELVNPGGKYVSLNHQKSLEFSRHVVLALGLLPRTYNLDWPLIELQADDSEVQALTAMPGFEVISVANGLQRRHGVRSYTFEGGPRIRAMLDESFDWPVSRIVNLLKVRVMLTEYEGRQQTIDAVPMAVLNMLTEAEVNVLFENFVNALDYPLATASKQFRTTESRLRLVQHTIAARFGRIWLEQFNLHAGTHRPWRPSSLEAGYLFSPPSMGLVMNAAHSIEPLLAHYQPPNRRAVNLRTEHHEQLRLRPGATFNRDLAQMQLTHPFIHMFHDKEVRARQLLKEKGAEALKDHRYRAITDRLKAGVTIKQLEDVLARGQLELAEDVRRRAVSQFIDLAVDEGIAVPVLVQTGNSFIRAYRHGEDVTFAEREFYIAKTFFEGIFEHVGSDRELGRTDAEKFTTILLRSGLKKEVFEPWSDRLGKGHAGPRWGQFGVVPRINSTTLFTNTDGERLSDVFLAQGVLAESPKALRKDLPGNHSNPFEASASESPESRARKRSRPKYKLGSMEARDDVSQDKHGHVVFLAHTLGRVRYSNPPLLTANELALITSCGRLPDLIKALAAEVHICLPLVRQYASALSGSSYLRSVGSDAFANTSFEDASHSGIEKFDAYTNGRLKRIHSRVANGLKSTVMESITWNELGSTLLEIDNEPVDDEATRLARRLDGWLRLVSIAAALGNIASDIESGRPYQAEVSKIQTMLNNAGTPRFLGGLQKWWAENREAVAARTIDTAAVTDIAVSSILEHLDRGQQLLDEAAARCDAHGGIRRIRTFSAALVITEPFAEGQAQALISDELLDRLAQSVATCKALHRNAEATNVPSPVAYQGALVVANGRDAATLLSDVAIDMIAHATDHGLNIKLTLVPRVLGHERLYHGTDQSDYFGDRFFQRMRAIRAAMNDDRRHPDRTLAILEPASEMAYTRGAIDHISSQVNISTTELDPPFNTSTEPAGVIERWTHTNARMRPMARRKFDLGVITVKAVETRAMVDALAKFGPTSDFAYEDATIRTGHVVTKDGEKISVGVIQCIDPNSNSAAIALNNIVAAAQPDLVALVGIAGGFSSKVQVNDVLIATQIIDYDQRKVTKDGAEWRGVAHVADPRVRRALEDFGVHHGEPGLLTSGHGDFHVLAAPLGTGGAVVATGNSAERERLQFFNSKTAGLETEAAGIAQSFYERTPREGYPYGYLVVRGISDLADEDKVDDHQKSASDNAAHALVDLLVCRHLKP